MKRILLMAALLLGFGTAVASAGTTGQHTIGYIGCSNTKGAVMGYGTTPGRALMWPGYNTDSGRIDVWAQSDSPFWLAYEQMVQTYGAPKVVWAQLCEQYLAQHDTYGDVQSMLTNLRQHAPGAVLYVSAINIYNPEAGLCSFMGPQGQGETDTEAWRDQAVQQGLAKRGPDLGPLSLVDVVSDHCHPSTVGETILGTELHLFFDTLPLFKTP